MAVDAVRPSTYVAGVILAAAAIGVLAGIDPRLAVAASLGLLFVALILNDVTLGLAMLAFVIFLEALPELGGFSIAKLLGVLLVVSWLATVASRTAGRTLFEDRPFFSAVLLLFLAWVALSVAWAESRPETVTALTRYGPNLLLIPIAYTAIRRPRDAVLVFGVIVAGAALAAAAGIVSPPPDPGTMYDPARATGTVGDANELAAALVVGMALAGAFTVNRGVGSTARALAAVTVLLCLAGILLSLSRGGLVALAVALAAAVVFSGRWRGPALALALVVGACGAFYFTSFASVPARERVFEVGGGTGRVDLWTVAWRMFEDQPLLGAGAGNFPVSSIHYLLRPGAIERDDFIISSAPLVTHNTYLQVLAETGLVGFVLFLGLVGFGLVTAVLAARTFARQGDERMEIMCRGLVIGLVGYLTALVFISEMYSKLLWLLLAMGPPLYAVARARDRPSSST